MTAFHKEATNNVLINGNVAFTANGDIANKSTLNNVLDLFSRAPSFNKKDDVLNGIYKQALQEDRELALRFLQYLRDCRGGAGRKAIFHQMLSTTIDTLGMVDEVYSIIEKLPELGYWKDILMIENVDVRDYAIRKYFVPAIPNNKLAAKYAPRARGRGKYSHLAKVFMHELGLIDTVKVDYKELDREVFAKYNKYLSGHSETVEQLITRKAWIHIKFKSVPGLAMVRHRKTFDNQCKELYQAYLDSLTKGETSIKAGGVDFAGLAARSKSNDGVQLINGQFEELLSKISLSSNIIPVCDLSGSMAWDKIGSSGNNAIYPIDAAIGISTALAKANKGDFKDLVMSFSNMPSMLNLSHCKTGVQAMQYVRQSQPAYSTDVDASIRLLLDVAVRNSVSQEDMPKYLVFLSDMQFNDTSVIFSGETFLQRMGTEYGRYGYEMPQVVFWNLESSNSQSALPVTINDKGVTLVSGYNTNLVNMLFSGTLDPIKVMLDVLMKDRYSL